MTRTTPKQHKKKRLKRSQFDTGVTFFQKKRGAGLEPTDWARAMDA